MLNYQKDLANIKRFKQNNTYCSISGIVNVHAHYTRSIFDVSAGKSDLNPLGFIAVFVSRLPEGLSAAVYEGARHAGSRRYGQVAPAGHVGAVPYVMFLISTSCERMYTSKIRKEYSFHIPTCIVDIITCTFGCY